MFLRVRPPAAGLIAAATLAAGLIALVLAAVAVGAKPTSPRPGAHCKRPGQTATTTAGKHLRCTRHGHKVVWVTTKAKSSPSSAAGGTSTGGTGSGGGQPGYAMVGGGGDSSAKDLPACSGTALLDHLPTSDVSSIEAMGHMAGEHILPVQADHIYLYPSAGAPAPTVYAPGNITVLQVVAQAHKGADAWLGTDYSVAFSPCRSTMFIYAHMTSLSSRIQAAVDAAKPICQTGVLVDNCVYPDLSVALASGETMGTALPPTSGLDLGATDVRTPTLAFIHTTSVTGGVLADSYAHAVCPLDYFVPALKSELYAKLKTQNAGANGIPACGAVMQDKAGTAQGNWYRPGTTAGQGNSLPAVLALAHDNLDPAQAVLSAGTDLLPSTDFGSQIVYQPDAGGLIDPDPSRITPDGRVYCIEGVLKPQGTESGHVDLTLSDATTLKADYAQGPCAATPTLSAAAVTYGR